jgi:hypothetical protein
MMTRNQLWSYYRNQIQAYTTDVIPEAHAFRLMDQGQKEVVKLTGCYTADGGFTSESGTEEYNLTTADGTNVASSMPILVCEDAIYRVLWSTTTELYPMSFEEARMFSGTISAGTTASTPSNYYIRFKGRDIVIGLDPTPNSATAVTVWYVKEPDDLTSNTSEIVVPRGWEYLIAEYAIVESLKQDKKFKTADRRMQKFMGDIGNLRSVIHKLDKSRTPRMMPHSRADENKRMDRGQRLNYGRN